MQLVHGVVKRTTSTTNWPRCYLYLRPSPVNWTRHPSSDWPLLSSNSKTSLVTVTHPGRGSNHHPVVAPRLFPKVGVFFFVFFFEVAWQALYSNNSISKSFLINQTMKDFSKLRKIVNVDCILVTYIPYWVTCNRRMIFDTENYWIKFKFYT